MLKVLPAMMAIAATGGFMPHAGAHGARVAADSTTRVLCGSHQHIKTANQAGASQYIIKNDNYGGELECLSIRNDQTNFTVVKSGAGPGHIEPVAYPDIFLGCSWGVCSPHSGLPMRVDRLGSLTTSWSTIQESRGQWAVGYDIWFNRSRRVAAQADGAELMIWLNSKGFPPNTWPVVMVDHVRWHLAHWTTARAGKRWNYVQFRRVHPATRVEHLNVMPFLRIARQYGFVKPHWWLTSVEAGFEIWRGGIGLGTTSYSARVTADAARTAPRRG
jgi:hypothetical protein